MCSFRLLKTEKLNWVLISCNLAGIMHDDHCGDFFPLSFVSCKMIYSSVFIKRWEIVSWAIIVYHLALESLCASLYSYYY
jgi:hypothetical protein